MEFLTIGQLAKCAGVSVETIRYYERRRLLADPGRRPSGYRRYTRDALKRLLFIRRGKELGFSLKEIQDLLALRTDPESTCSDVRARARAKISDIEARIASLEQMRRALKRLSAKCRRGRPTSECPILEILDREDNGHVNR